jgi:DNA-binding PadR family transcriptional regulator
MNSAGIKALQREILLGFWKVHILHHAAEGPVVGQWMIQELRHHGYDVSPGTMYPLLARLERLGWLACRNDPAAGPRARKEYTLTRSGRDALTYIRRQLAELQGEVNTHEEKPPKGTRKRK